MSQLLRVVCAWCQLQIRVQLAASGGVSHGICMGCRARRARRLVRESAQAAAIVAGAAVLALGTYGLRLVFSAGVS